MVAAFDAQDGDLAVRVSHARYAESLFGELEHDAERVRIDGAQAAERAQELQTRLDAAEEGCSSEQQRAAAAERELAALRSTRLVRWSGPARSLYGRLYRH